MSFTWKEIEKEFKNQGPISKAGFAHDLSKHVFEGGLFWYIGEAGRHLGGKNYVYSDYYYRIYHLRDNMYFNKASEIALEAAEYARKQGDMLQFWGFLYEAGYVDYALFRVITYCRIARKATTPRWYWQNTLYSCEYFWSKYKEMPHGEKRDAYLIYLGKVAIDAYRYVIVTYGDNNDAKVTKLLDEACLYISLSQLAEMSEISVFPNERRETQEKFLSEVKGVCNDYQALLKRLKKEGVNTSLLEKMSPSIEIYKEFLSLRTKTASDIRSEKVNNINKPHNSEEDVEQERLKRQEARLQEQKRIAEELEQQRIVKERKREQAKAKRRVFFTCVILIIGLIKFLSVQINANKDN